MTRFVLEINCDNEAFVAQPEITGKDYGISLEVGRILKALGEDIAAFDPDEGSVRDINGNTVGKYRFES